MTTTKEALGAGSIAWQQWPTPNPSDNPRRDVDTVNPTHKQATTGPDSPAQVLRDAALYLQRHGWTQGDYYTHDTTAGMTAACALGAICITVRGTRVAAFLTCTDTPSQRTAIVAAADHLAGWLARTHDDFSVELYNHDVEGDDYALDNVITDWNDEPERTAAEVIACMRAAAHAWDRTHGGTR